MDMNLRRPTAIFLLATGCMFSAASEAYSAADDSDAQAREVTAAYDRGYKAAKEELAHKSATQSSPVAGSPTVATPSLAKKAAPPRAQKPILDIKHTYSDASEIETVQVVPVSATPLPEQPRGLTLLPAEAYPAPSQSAARDSAGGDGKGTDEGEAVQEAQPVRSAHSPAPYDSASLAARSDPRQQAAPSDVDGEGDRDDADAPRLAQPLAATAQYAPPQGQYAAQAIATPRPPQAYTYGYVQQPAYAAPRPYGYYAQPTPYVAQYQPMPQGRWYWSPQYGRWLYY